MCMKCLICKRDNRQEAKFCRFCGEEINVSVQETVETQVSEKKDEKITSFEKSKKEIDGFIGHQEIRDELNKFINKRRIEKRREQSGFEPDMANHIFLFNGSTGTGKFSVSQWFANKLKSEKLVSGKIGTYYAKELKNQYQDEFAFRTFLEQNSFGVLIIREVHFDTEYLGEILRAVSSNKSGCICICIGLKNKLDIYFKDNPDNRQRINSFFDFKNYSDQQLFEILEIYV